ncbi:MAG: septation protein IspZ [Proteobacteria bacterium]|nr:septation protein IspZ [Pseudomonadota bacterium]
MGKKPFFQEFRHRIDRCHISFSAGRYCASETLACGPETDSIEDWLYMFRTLVARYLNRDLLVEFFPPVVFLVSNFAWDIMVATAATIVATAISVLLAYIFSRKVPVIAVITLVIVLCLGGASLYFGDESFIKIKPTVGRTLFALALGISLLLGKNIVYRVLGGQISLTERGWTLLTYFWIIFALSLAVLNEILRRVLTTDTWVIVDTAAGPLSILGYVLITRITAEYYWDEEAEET